LQNIAEFSDLRLVGGTALALQLGHRISVDLDLFGKTSIDEIEILILLSGLGNVVSLKKSANINIYSINNIKVDIVNYPYDWIAKPIAKDSLLLADKKDIAMLMNN